jgi:hypothetical protein
MVKVKTENSTLEFLGEVVSNGKDLFDLSFNEKIILIRHKNPFKKGDKVRILIEKIDGKLE